MKVLNLSHDINKYTPLYGGNRRVSLFTEKAIQNKDSSNVLRLMINTHTSTHVDVPFHFIRKGKTLTDYPADSWVFNNVLIKDCEIKPGGCIAENNIGDFQCEKNVDLLIIKTGFEKFRGRVEYINNSPIVYASLAKFLKIKLPGLRAIGFDFISLSSMKDRKEGRCAHREFLKNNILIVEDMKLSHLASKPDFILVSPLFIDKADGGPVTAWGFYRDFNMADYDFIFFDFDGVILQSVDIKTEAFKEIYIKFGKDISRKVAHHHLANGGMSRFDKFRLYHRKFLGINLNENEINILAERFSGIVFAKILKANFVPGVKDFLTACKKNKKKCFLVSATPEKELGRIVKGKGLFPYFVAVKGSPETKIHNLATLLQKYNIDRRKSLFFGDSVNDLNAANGNNIKFVGINYNEVIITYPNFRELMKHGSIN